MEGTFMKKINLRNPLVIYCLTLASLILTIGVIYVIVDVNSKLAPEKQILFSPDDEKNNEDNHFLKVTVWEQRTDVIRTHHSGYYSSEGYMETTLKKGEKVRVAGVQKYYLNEENVRYRGSSEGATFAAYADADLTVRFTYLGNNSYWGKPFDMDEGWLDDKLNYIGENGNIRIQDALMFYGNTFYKTYIDEDQYILDDRGKPLDHRVYTERICDVNPTASGPDAYVQRDVYDSVIEFIAYSLTDPEKIIAFAKIRVVYRSDWNFKDMSKYYEKLEEMGITDIYENRSYTTAELIDYWESDDLR